MLPHGNKNDTINKVLRNNKYVQVVGIIGESLLEGYKKVGIMKYLVVCNQCKSTVCFKIVKVMCYRKYGHTIRVSKIYTTLIRFLDVIFLKHLVDSLTKL